MTKLVDSAADEFTATYDAEGRILTDGYPDGLTATYTYNQVGAATGIEYVKSAHCATKCPETWFSDTVLSSIHGQTLGQTSTLAKESYVYDEAGRLTETQETPAGKGCKARIYAYNEESDRTSETSRESATETCPTEGGTTETHSYDTANRLDDTGTTYEPLGNATKLPAADAGEHALTSTYYVDSQLATQEQNGKSIKYSYDPAGRALETETKEGATTATTTTHYSGPGEALTWASENNGGVEKWTRNIPGIDGALAAIQTSAGTTRLQLHDLQGDIIGEAGLSETETKLLSTYNSTEFGVPTTSSHPKYSWLGAGGIASELPSGIIAQGGASYVPQIARDLQTAPVIAPGAFPNGSGTPSPHVSEIPGWTVTLANQESAATVTEWTAKQKAREEEALRKCQEEGGCGAPTSSVEGGVEEEEGGVDPEFSILLTTRQAEVVATVLRQGPAALQALALSGLIKGVTAFFAERIDEIGKEYMQGAAYGLELCYTAIHASTGVEARCKLWVDDWQPEKNVYWVVAYGVETCWGAKYKRKNSVHWTFPQSQCALAAPE